MLRFTAVLDKSAEHATRWRQRTRGIFDAGEELPPPDGFEERRTVLPKVHGLYAGDEKGIDASFISHYTEIIGGLFAI